MFFNFIVVLRVIGLPVKVGGRAHSYLQDKRSDLMCFLYVVCCFVNWMKLRCVSKLSLTFVIIIFYMHAAER